MINSNRHPISYRFGLSRHIVQILDTLRFRTTLWGLRHNVRCSSWAHWKARSGLPIRAKRDQKSAISLQRGLFDVEGVVPTNHFRTDS